MFKNYFKTAVRNLTHNKACSKDILSLVVISILISIPLTWIAANKWLQNYPYRITLSWLRTATHNHTLY